MKPGLHADPGPSPAILPALLAGSGLKHLRLGWSGVSDWHSPGFIGWEWIETSVKPTSAHNWIYSPGFIGWEWIETAIHSALLNQAANSPGFIGWEWIETGVQPAAYPCHHILPALLAGSGLKLINMSATDPVLTFSRLYWLGVD